MSIAVVGLGSCGGGLQTYGEDALEEVATPEAVEGDCSDPALEGVDDDHDGVCDADDACHGADDHADEDGDDTPDGCDPCPLDVDDDSDADEVCDSDDLCDGHDDRLDRDADLLPDGCDTCPDDPTNDADGDHECGQVDLCPDDATNTCTRDLLVAVRVDPWFGEARWELVEGGTSLHTEGFTIPSEAYVRTVPVQVLETACIFVEDDYGDGGIEGIVWDPVATEVLTSWTASEYGTDGTFCFVADGPPGTAALPVDPYTWSGGVSGCDVRVQINTLLWGNEVGWEIRDSRGGLVAGQPAGTYGSSTSAAHDLVMYPGDYSFTMLDSYGDGWHNGTYSVGVLLTGQVIASGSLNTGFSQTDPFTLTCPP